MSDTTASRKSEGTVLASRERKRTLELPIKLILTQEGSTFFIRQNKKLLRFSLAGNVEEYGISMETFAPDSVQRLVLANYISKVEIYGSFFYKNTDSGAEFTYCSYLIQKPFT